MTSIRRALAWSFAERYALLVLAFAGNILLARLLTPEQLGIYSVSLAVIGIAQVLRDFGISTYLIQERDLRDERIRTAFGISLLLGGTLFALVWAASPWAAAFYNEPRMLETLHISSMNFLVLPFCAISLSLLRRDMLFGRLAAVGLIASAVGLIVTVALAYQGFGPNSMAVGSVITNLTTGIAAWIANSKRRLMLPSLSEWRQILSFGGQSSVAAVVSTISMDINDLALGKILGFAPVAIMSRAQGLMSLFHRDVMRAIRNVALPAYAAIHRSGQPLEAQYVRSVGAVTVMAWPFYGFLSLFPIEILTALFGSQWKAAAPLVPLYCLAGAVIATSNHATRHPSADSAWRCLKLTPHRALLRL